MSDGQLAINTNLASPGLFFKDSNGDLVKVGPVHVGTTAPNVTPGSGGQAGNSKGEQWLDTSSSRYVFKIWDGSAWRSEDGEFVNASGDTMTGNLTLDASSLVFDTGTFNTTVSATTATAARAITIPDTTGTLVTTGDTGTVTSTMLLDGTIVDADINASAEIAVSKLADGTARQLLQTDAAGTGVEWASNIDIPGTLDVTGAAVFDSTLTAVGNVTLNAQADLRFADADSSNWVAFQAPATVAANVTWTLPSADGSASQVLQTNGSGTLSWATVSGGGGGDVFLASANAFTGANTFTNSTGQTFRQAATQDGILLRGRAGGTTSRNVEIVPASLTASRVLTAPDVTGTIVTTGDTGTVTSTMIADGTIANGDISGSAAISITKLASSTISGISLGNNLNSATFNNAGTGGASGSTYNGSAALTVSYNTVGAPSTTGTNATGTWGISVSGSAATLTTGRTISLTGDVTGTSGTFNGSANLSFATTLANASVSAANLDGAQSGSAPIYAPRAWVNFDGVAATPTSRASGNVSSITDNGTGDYTVNFTTAFADTNYATVGSTTRATYTTSGEAVLTLSGASPATGSRRVQSRSGSGSLIDAIEVSIIFIA
jgi:hypothetical protein